jgi:hypothetical protein
VYDIKNSLIREQIPEIFSTKWPLMAVWVNTKIKRKHPCGFTLSEKHHSSLKYQFTNAARSVFFWGHAYLDFWAPRF